MESDFSKIIKNSKVNRLTAKTQSIFLILKQSHHPITAKFIMETMQKTEQKIDLSTIYRALKRLVKLDIATKVIRENIVLYELSGQFIQHHHHFTCNYCNKIYVLDKCVIDLIKSKDVAELESHNIELFGRCTNCKSV